MKSELQINKEAQNLFWKKKLLKIIHSFSHIRSLEDLSKHVKAMNKKVWGIDIAAVDSTTYLEEIKRRNSKKILKIIFFKWADAAMLGAQQISGEEARDYGLIQGYVAGILVRETKDAFIVAMDWFPGEDQFRQVHAYPKTGVEKDSIIVKQIEYGRKDH